MFELSLAILLTLLAMIGWLANLLGMPGNWLIVLLGSACWWFRPAEYASSIALSAIVAMVVIALVGELLEFVAGALGAKKVGGSTRGTLLAMGGSMAGAMIGLFAGTLIPIPIVGNLLASLLLGGVGAFSGALVGERWSGKDWDASIQIGSAAFWGRLLGTVAKAACGTVVCGIFLAAIWL